MSSSRNMRNSAAQHADLVDELVNESGSETDLDLPDPSTFLSTSSPTHQAPDATVTFVPETPPSLVSNSKEDIQQDTTPKSTQQRVTATYSAKNSPRASVSSWRSLNANLNMRQEQEDVNGSPTRKRRREALLVGASSLTAVNGSSTIDNVKSIVIAKDTKSLQPTTPRRGRKRTSEAVRTVEKDTNVLQTSQRKRPTRNEDVGAAVKSKPAGTTGAELRLLTTGLSDAQLGRLRRAAKQMMEQQIAATVDIHNSTELLGIPAQKGGYTHLIAAVGKDGRASRTFKYLAALASGAWLVTVDWLLESVKAQNLLPEAEFAVKGDCALPNYSLSGPRSIHELLCKYQIHLWPSSGWDSSAHSQAELQRLIHATGAKVIDALPASENLSTAENYVPTSILPHDNSGVSGARKTTNNGVGGSMEREIKAVPAKYRWLFELPVREDVPVVLVDTSSLKGARSNIALGAIVSTTGGTIPCRTKSWLFDCISANTTL
ncbi:hypothetical protein COEREDRAFT_81918 [Coemansia reversa NRRL 1564]|uniref:BRCT domain-containing protein n=1 Tax=Coemansia reversa (strain ATCC 12441 / NRRL 1564) TaxID=763665 RepID=A0A2G5B9C2_COERN|nr:hypothetical protein COEREDRAFT_81918 [Coemansia reversa NRRL 1564]|eukprot:PIA15590.1 hypothetical protein COEREDRAFT_81918 [Coemansia reversa NRRL 1564]